MKPNTQTRPDQTEPKGTEWCKLGCIVRPEGQDIYSEQMLKFTNVAPLTRLQINSANEPSPTSSKRRVVTEMVFIFHINSM